MGREAICSCILDEKRFEVKALLEPPELILRGGIRRRVPFAAMERVIADGRSLQFRVDRETFCLQLEEAQAAKWAQTILAPPPTLAKKLGIDPATRVRIIGEIDDDDLQNAVSGAQQAVRGTADVVLARVSTLTELNAALKKENLAEIDEAIRLVESLTG